MSDRILVATRKGLFTVERNGGAWKIARTDFLADHVSMVLADPRDGSLYAGLDHGHFGVKMHTRNGEAAWEEMRRAHLSGEARGRRRQRHVGQAHPVDHVQDLGAGDGRS